MSVRQEVTTNVIVGGQSRTIRLISHISIDDIMYNEMEISAYEMENGTVIPGRRVNRDIRDYVILIGVER